jgi:energy-coupling factor transport system permease protein
MARFGGGAIAILGTLVCIDLRLLGAAFLTVVALSVISDVKRQFLRFLVAILLPMALALTFVWVGVMGAPPGTPMGTDRPAALEYALLIILRLAVCSGLFQITLLSIAPEKLLPTLRALRLPEELAVMVLSTLIILPELKLRADQVLTARLARGLFGNPTLPNKLRQVPHMLGPLVSWTLRSALQRAETWEHRAIMDRLYSLPFRIRYSGISSLLVTLASVVFFGLAVYSRVGRVYV